MPNRPTDEQYLDVCRHCIAHLSEKHANEKGLFRSSVSQTEVRALQSQILQFSNNTFRDEPDPHIVAEVLQTTFKNLTYPLLHEVYQDIVETDLDDEDFDISELTIQKWIVKLPEAKFYVTSALFQLLSRLAALDESDTNLIQLAYCVSPTICRPIDSAYMSIRHMEDLRKIRPVISFIIENCDEVFVDGLQPLPFPYNSSNPNSPSVLGGRHLTNQVSLGFGSFVDGIVSDDPTDKGGEGDISTMMSTAMVIDTGSPGNPSGKSAAGGGKGDKGGGDDAASVTSMDESSSVSSGEREGMTSSSKSEGSAGHPSKRPHLLVSIPSTSLGADAPVPVTAGANAATVEVDPLQQYSDTEWNVLEALISARATLFLDHDDNRSQETYMSSRSDSFDRRSGSIDGAEAPGTPNSQGSRRNSGNFSSPTMAGLHGHGHGGSGGSVDGSVPGMLSSPPSAPHSHSPSSTQSKAVFKNRRRRMVADCKALRAQIFEFEQDWMKKHNRVPKNFERGAMESVYTRYRKLKKEIRDLAAMDIQRCCRGFVARVRRGIVTKETLRLVRQKIAANPNPSAATTTAAATAAAAGSSTVSGAAGSSGTTTISVSPKAAASPSPAPATAPATSATSASAPSSSSSTSHIPVPASATSAPAASAAAIDMYGQYRALLVQKRDLKRELKKFDEEFLEKWGRAPRKSDKEVIRPMYQNYHEIKGKLDQMRATIEASHGPLPEDLQEDPRASFSSTSTGSSGLSVNSATPTREGSAEELEGASDDVQMSIGAGSDSEVLAGATASAAGAGPMQAEDGVGSLGYGGVTKKVINVEGELEALQMEKRNLHAYLKVYERDFSRLHGRPVTKHADIQPVAHEYQRYKELKNLIREKKMKLGSK